MLTVPITAAITALLAVFGIKPTVTQVAGVAVVVKIVIVLVGVFLGNKLLKRRQAAAALAEKKEPDPGAPCTSRASATSARYLAAGGSAARPSSAARGP